MNQKTLLFGTVLGVLTVLGLFGIIWRFLADLHETGINHYVVWGLWVAAYIYMLGLSAGAFLLASTVYFFRIKHLEPFATVALPAALGCMVGGAVLIWMDLGHPWRLFYVFGLPNPSSLLSWEAYLYGIYGLLILLQCGIVAGVTSTDNLPLSRQRVLVALAAGGILTAVVVRWATGALLAVVKSRPEWNTGATPVALIASAVASGTALVAVLGYLVLDHNERFQKAMQQLTAVVAAALLVEIVVLVSEALVVWYGGVEEEIAAYRHLYFGPFSWVTWIVHALIGLALPLGVFLSPLRRKPSFLALASLCVVIGVVGYVLNIVVPAQIDAPFRELLTSYTHPRNQAYYFPTTLEWLSTLGALTLGVWVCWGGIRLLQPSQASVHA